MNTLLNVPQVQTVALPGSLQANPTRRILVVDDDISILQLSTEALIHSGYHVDAAEDGASAWNTLQRNSYDLVVTDQNMPKVTGVELVKKLRAARMALPVILVSGAMPAEVLNLHPCLQLTATLLKPFTAVELLLAVKEVLHATAGVRASSALPGSQQTRPPAAGALGMR
jgi:two-component system alkaline phosphatase synthesis response regulator PhoP